MLSPHPIFHDTETPLSWRSLTQPGPAVNITTSLKLNAVFSPFPGIKRRLSTSIFNQLETLFRRWIRFAPDNFVEFKSNTRVATRIGAWLGQSTSSWEAFLLGCTKLFVRITLKWFRSSSYSTTSIVKRLIVSAVLFVSSLMMSSRIVCEPLSRYDGTPKKRFLELSNSSQDGVWN